MIPDSLIKNSESYPANKCKGVIFIQYKLGTENADYFKEK
jgi:hypothetical protein